MRYRDGLERQSGGLLPIIFNLLKKYNLLTFVDAYFESSLFPTKHSWKSILERHVLKQDIYARHARLENQYPKVVFDDIFPHSGSIHFWCISRNNPDMLVLCYNGTYMLSKLLSKTFSQQCIKCLTSCENIIIHKVYFCPANASIRNDLFQKLFRILGINKYKEFMSLTAELQLFILLGSNFCTEYSAMTRDLLKMLYIMVS
jgi:hypothetical protein